MSKATFPAVRNDLTPTATRGCEASAGVVQGKRSAIRLLGGSASSGNNPHSDSMTDSAGALLQHAGLGSELSVAQTGSRMDSIDDDWDIEQPAAAGVAEVSPAVTNAPTRSESKGAATPERPSASPLPSKWPPSGKSASQEPGTGRFSSPLGLRSPATASKPPEQPVTTAAQAESKREKETEPASPAKPMVSKVQLAAEAFRQKSAAQGATHRTTPEAKLPAAASIASPKPSQEALAFPAVEAAQQVTVSPVVAIEESLELQEIIGESDIAPETAIQTALQQSVEPAIADEPQPVQAPQDRITPVAILSFPPPAQGTASEGLATETSAEHTVDPSRGDVEPKASALSEPVQANLEETKPQETKPQEKKPQETKPAESTEPLLEKQAAEKQAADTEKVSTSGLAAAARKDSTKIKLLSDKHPSGRHSVGKLQQDPSLSLDASYAVEFFSAAPPQAHFEAGLEHEHELEHEAPRLRTAEQVARQAYLRSIVIKVMVAVAVFAVVVVFTMWRRGMIRFLQ